MSDAEGATANGESAEGVIRVRKRPVEHDAILYTGRNCDDVAAFLGLTKWVACECDGQEPWVLETMHGPVEAVPGTYIVKGERDCWPVDAEQFADTYEVVPFGSSGTPTPP
jgi:hypothetical protein